MLPNEEMSELLRIRGLTGTPAFAHPFVHEIAIKPDWAAFNYSIPSPDGSPEGSGPR